MMKTNRTQQPRAEGDTHSLSYVIASRQKVSEGMKTLNKLVVKII